MNIAMPLRVILESPYAGGIEPSWLLGFIYRTFPRLGVMANVRYARACLRDSLLRGEAPIASHLLYTQPGVLRDGVPAERDQGIAAGLAWGSVADATVVYVDRGISPGMIYGINRARAEGRPVYYRSLWMPGQWTTYSTPGFKDLWSAECNPRVGPVGRHSWESRESGGRWCVFCGRSEE